MSCKGASTLVESVFTLKAEVRMLSVHVILTLRTKERAFAFSSVLCHPRSCLVSIVYPVCLLFGR